MVASECCQGEGIIAQTAEIKLWMVCNNDVYLPPYNCLSVVDAVTNTTIPLVDPALPDPLNFINISVINAPNARAEGEPLCAWLVGWFVCVLGWVAVAHQGAFEGAGQADWQHIV